MGLPSRPRPQTRGLKTALTPFLRQLVEERPELTVRILVWSIAILHAPSATMPLLVEAEWQDHPRITLKLDREHPIYASHHQKIVVVDDRLAFCGGIDLTVKRWDTPDHRPDNPMRVDPDGVAYGPTHDIQMMVDGDAAGALSEIVRDRWRRACGEDLDSKVGEPAENPWPRTCTPHFRNVTIAVARTVPAWRGCDQVEEISALTRDLLLAAERRIYIESQYFCARELRTIVERILTRPTGPEIVVIVGRNGEGVFEHWVMGKNRTRMIRHLNSLDRYKRLNVYCPIVEGPEGDCDVAIHAKCMTIDDTYLRVGSANLNNRSMGLDTECDLVVVAEDEAARTTIAQFRSRLLAEHLGVCEDDVAEAVGECNMTAAIKKLNTNPRRLRSFPAAARRGSVHSVPGTAFLDPRRPLGLNWALRRSAKA